MEAFDRSSSNELSSAPSSDIEGPFNTHPAIANNNTIIVSRDSAALSTNSNSANLKNAQPSSTRQGSAPKQRKPRKKKEVDPNAPPAAEKEKKPRKPRASAGTTGNARKKVKTEDAAPVAVVEQHSAPSADLSKSTLIQPAAFLTDTRPPLVHEAAKTSQNGFLNHSPAMNSQPQSPTSYRQHTNAPQLPVAVPRSRDIFDPVRGILYKVERDPTTYDYIPPSASPAISSILNHPEVKPQTQLPYQAVPQLVSLREESVPVNGTSSAAIPIDSTSSSSEQASKNPTSDKPAVDSENKPKRAKEQPPPMPAGSGLLNSTFFGGDSTTQKPEELGKGVSIVLNLDLKRGESKIFNFARMAEEKYGFAAVFPRQAAQKARLAKVAAAGAALERTASNSKRGETSLGESGDEDLSVDIDHDSDNDGDINMGGVNGTNENSGTDGPVAKQRRKRRDDYDADDPFVDDSEMLWEAQAAASKDGFFVFMGPLVPEGEKAPIEKSESASRRGGRGRGRGGGPGSRGGRGGASGVGAEASGRGGGVPTRGNGITRKPRITKAERQQREMEKKQREQAGTALAAKAPQAPA